jgi:hypothetical protein
MGEGNEPVKAGVRFTLFCHEFVPLSQAHRVCPAMSPLHVVLLREGTLARYEPVTTARFIYQPLHALREKPLHPFVDMATAQSDCRSNVSDRHPVSAQ